MSVLVTGGAGYIGSHMVYALTDVGKSVVVVDDLSTGFPHLLPPNVPLVVGSVGNTALVEKVILDHRVDTIIHFAAVTVVPESIVQPIRYYKNNTADTLSLIAAAVACKVKHFIFSSTAAVYGSVTNRLVKEADATFPISPYGRSKLMVEAILHDAALAHGFGYVALRYFNVAGADPQGRTGQSTASATHLLKVACQAVLGVRPRLEIFGTDYPTADGTCVRDYVHVSDLTQAHLHSISYLQNGGQSRIMNCGYGHGYSVFEVVDSVRRVSGRELPTVTSRRRAGDPSIVVADNSEICSHLGWKPAYDNLDVIVAHALKWEMRLQDEAAKVRSERKPA